MPRPKGSKNKAASEVAKPSSRRDVIKELDIKLDKAANIIRIVLDVASYEVVRKNAWFGDDGRVATYYGIPITVDKKATNKIEVK